jgi:AcrR family transcriptional regulator
MKDEGMAENRRTQAERAAQTRESLIAAARPLFAQHGFAEVTQEMIVRAAGMTRGAFYHHFADKTELFAAAFEQVESEMVARMGAAIASADVTDPVEIMQLGARFWLDACADPEIQRIVLIDAPSTLGWARWTEIGDRYNNGLVRELVTTAIHSGRIPAQPVEATVVTILGAMREATLYVARSDDHELARQEAEAVMKRLIGALEK